MTLLVLIRHGLTATTGKRLGGWTPGVHLSDRGREQADSLVDRLEGLRLDAIYSSPLERCRETAEPLATARRLRVEVRNDLGEVRYGEWTDRPLGQLMRTKLWRRIQSTPSSVRFPDGESLLEVQARAVDAIETIRGEHPRHTVACFSHADVIKLLLVHHCGTSVDLFQRLIVDPCSVSAIAVGEGLPRILRMNDTGPIADLAPKRGRSRTPAARRRKVGG